MPAPPIYRPMARRCPPQADKSAVRQYIVRLRGIADLGCENSLSRDQGLPLPGLLDLGQGDISAFNPLAGED